MIHTLNLVKQVPDKQVRAGVVRMLFGIVPSNGKTYSIDSISRNEDYYRKLAEKIEREGSKKQGV